LRNKKMKKIKEIIIKVRGWTPFRNGEASPIAMEENLL